MKKDKEPTIFFKKRDLLDYYDIGEATFQRLLELGLPAKKLGPRWMIHREVFEKFLKDFNLSTATTFLFLFLAQVFVELGGAAFYWH